MAGLRCWNSSQDDGGLCGPRASTGVRLCAAIGVTPSTNERERLTAALAQSRTRLTPGEWQAAWVIGPDWASADAVAAAPHWAALLTAGLPARAGSTKTPGNPETPRPRGVPVGRGVCAPPEVSSVTKIRVPGRF